MEGRTRAPRVTGAARASLADDLAQGYRSGESIRELAARTGWSYGFVRGLLGEAGVQLRGRGGATRNRAARVAAD